jgi:hypothetical protein
MWHLWRYVDPSFLLHLNLGDWGSCRLCSSIITTLFTWNMMVRHVICICLRNFHLQKFQSCNVEMIWEWKDHHLEQHCQLLSDVILFDDWAAVLNGVKKMKYPLHLVMTEAIMHNSGKWTTYAYKDNRNASLNQILALTPNPEIYNQM